MATPNNAIIKEDRSASAAPLPSQMPKKSNPLHSQILSSLLKIGQTTRPEVRTRFDKKLQKTVDQIVAVPVPTLAGNVSEQNIDRAAKRWI